MTVDACQLAGVVLPWLSALLCPERPALTLACDLLQCFCRKALGSGSFLSPLSHLQACMLGCDRKGPSITW